MLAVAAAACLPLRAQHGSDAYTYERERNPELLSGPLDHPEQPFDVLHYDVTLDLTAAPSKELKFGKAIITLRWLETPEGLPFVFHLRDLTIDSARFNGRPRSVATVGVPEDAAYRHLMVPTEETRAGDTSTITIFYHGTMTDEFGPRTWGGVSSGNGVLYAMGVGFANNYVSTTQHWLPCYDHPSDKATFTGRFLVPDGMTAASNGLLEDRIESGEGSLFVWNHRYPAATYLLTFAVAPYEELNVGTEELPMLLYAVPADTAQTRKSFAKLPDMVNGFARRFGPYPFEKVGYCNTPQGAMEHQTMVSYPTSLARSGDSINSVGAHELAHQWFGDLVSPVDFRHAWLNESFATFCEAIWFEELAGFPAYISLLDRKRVSYFGLANSEGVLPLYDFPREAPSSNYPATIYEKGAVVVGMLRYDLGDSLFFAAMRTYLNRYAYATASTDDLQNVLEEVSGKDLDIFFEEWVRGIGWPQLSIDVAAGVGRTGATIRIRQMQPAEYGIFRDVPLEIGLVTQQGTVEYRVIRLDQADQTFELDLDVPVVDATVNEGPSFRALVAVVNLRTSGVRTITREKGSPTFTVNPNMIADGTLRIDRSGDAAAGPTIVNLYDSSGRRIAQQKIESFPHNYNVSDLFPSHGYYLVQFLEGEIERVIPVVIER